LECKNEHFWTHAPGVFVGSLVVRVRGDANEETVLARVQNLFNPLVTHLTVQVEKDDFSNIYHKQNSH
jgi:heme-binding NEAT domain protein